MSEQNVFSERCSSTLHIRCERNAAQFAKRTAFVATQRQRNQTGASLHQSKAELTRDFVAKVRRPDLGNRQAASCDDERLAYELTEGCEHDEMSIFADARDEAVNANFDSCGRALLQEHVDDLL